MDNKKYSNYDLGDLMLWVSEKCHDNKQTELLKQFTTLLCHGEVDRFKENFAEDVRLTMYKYKTLQGRDNIIDYWQDWKVRFIDTNTINNLELKHSYYTNQTCLVIQGTMLLLIRVENDVIKDMLTCLRYPDEGNNYGVRFDMESLPLDYTKTKDCLRLVEDKSKLDTSNRMPCQYCGKSADELEWHEIHIHRKKGFASVCPVCKRIVEFSGLMPDIEVSEIGWNTDDLTKGADWDIKNSASNEKNAETFSLVGLKFRKWLSDVIGSQKESEINIDDNCLDEIQLSDGCHLVIHLVDEEKQVGNSDAKSKICVHQGKHVIYNDGEYNIANYLMHFNLTPNRMAAWQLHLLLTAPTVLPTFGHGGYIKRNLIFSEDDIKTISPLKYYDITALKNDNILLPSVTMKDNVADIYCCCWNEWRGLIREHATIVFEGNKAKDYVVRTEDVVCAYDCGIFF